MIEDTRRANILMSLALPSQNDCARSPNPYGQFLNFLFYLGRMRPDYRNRVPAKGSCGGDAADEVLLLGDGFGADGKGVKEIERERIAQSFILAIAQVALAKDLHADDPLSGGAHFAENTDDGVGIGVHV